MMKPWAGFFAFLMKHHCPMLLRWFSIASPSAIYGFQMADLPAFPENHHLAQCQTHFNVSGIYTKWLTMNN